MGGNYGGRVTRAASSGCFVEVQPHLVSGSILALDAAVDSRPHLEHDDDDEHHGDEGPQDDSNDQHHGGRQRLVSHLGRVVRAKLGLGALVAVAVVHVPLRVEVGLVLP